MQAVRLQSGEAWVVCTGLQLGQLPATLGSPSENQTLVTSQPFRETDKNRSEGCQAQQIRHVPDGRSDDRQEIICRDIVSD